LNENKCILELDSVLVFIEVTELISCHLKSRKFFISSDDPSFIPKSSSETVRIVFVTSVKLVD